MTDGNGGRRLIARDRAFQGICSGQIARVRMSLKLPREHAEFSVASG